MRESPKDILTKYLPESVVEDVLLWIESEKVRFIVKKTRKTKLGDYRFPFMSRPNTITINGDLNKWAFLIVTLHEFAHLFTFKQYGKDVKPHGQQWKRNFSMLLSKYQMIFPEDLKEGISMLIKNPKATSASNTSLINSLMCYDESSDLVVLEKIAFGARFIFKERIFIKQEKRRVRYICQECDSLGRIFLFSPNALVRQY